MQLEKKYISQAYLLLSLVETNLKKYIAMQSILLISLLFRKPLDKKLEIIDNQEY